MKNINFYSPATVQVRSQNEGNEAESRTIEGYAILFNTLSAPLWEDEDEVAREQIAPEAVTKSLLDGCDIKMTMNHDFACLLARSKNGSGSLQYEVDEHGVKFRFDAPNTDDGDRALELVKRGDIDGCSFMFSSPYGDKGCVERTVVKNKDTGKTEITYTIRCISNIMDFTLTPMPAYPDTEVSARDIRNLEHKGDKTSEVKVLNQVRCMRLESKRKL